MSQRCNLNTVPDSRLNLLNNISHTIKQIFPDFHCRKQTVMMVKSKQPEAFRVVHMMKHVKKLKKRGNS